jgi:hypothetical protein
MRTKAFTLLESLVCLIIAFIPLSMFNTSNRSMENPQLNQTFMNHYIHQQFMAIYYHQVIELSIPMLNFTEQITFNKKGNVLQNAIIQLSSKNKNIHVSFVTGRIYESQP